jgi:hypothetical protein
MEVETRTSEKVTTLASPSIPPSKQKKAVKKTLPARKAKKLKFIKL